MEWENSAGFIKAPECCSVDWLVDFWEVLNRGGLLEVVDRK